MIFRDSNGKIIEINYTKYYNKTFFYKDLLKNKESTNEFIYKNNKDYIKSLIKLNEKTKKL